MQVRAFERYIPLIRNDTSDGMWIADEKRFATVQVRARTDEKGLKQVDTNRH